MFCPNCRAEYVEEISECPDCGITLVADLPPEPTAIHRSRLKTVTLLALLATAYAFILRVTGTFLPVIFANLTAARTTTILNLSAGLVMLLFFIYLRVEYTAGIRKTLEKAALFGIIAALATIILDLKSLYAVFSGDFNPASVGSRYLDIILPLASSFFIMIYFILFRRGVESKVLTRSALYALFASIIVVVTHIFTLVNYVWYGQFRWLSFYAVKNIIVFLPIFTFVFVAYFLFFLSFHKELQ